MRLQQCGKWRSRQSRVDLTPSSGHVISKPSLYSKLFPARTPQQTRDLSTHPPSPLSPAPTVRTNADGFMRCCFDLTRYSTRTPKRHARLRTLTTALYSACESYLQSAAVEVTLGFMQHTVCDCGSLRRSYEVHLLFTVST
jgi:hypothetical protein